MSTLTLNEVPGFADVADASLAANKPALGLHIARINSNAAFGMVRTEVFQGTYVNGDTVAAPVSPVDGYQYQRDELMYLWVFQTTANPKTGWASNGPPWTMWYVAALVNQATGEVSCNVGYRGNDDHKDRQANLNDGTLLVFTIAQRQRTALSLSAVPGYFIHNDADFYTDRPTHTGLLTEMSQSAKYGVVNSEVIFMGVFKHGDVVPTAVSPADGYVYDSSQVYFQTALRWTADDDGTNMKVPDMGKGQLQDWSSGVSLDGLVSITVTYQLSGQHNYHTGRVAVFAFCQRNLQLSLIGSANVTTSMRPWDAETTTPNSAYQYSGSLAPSSLASARLAVTPGDVIRIKYRSGTNNTGTGDGRGDLPIFTAAPVTSTPGKYLPATGPFHHGVRGVIGVFVNGSGASTGSGTIVGTPFSVGNQSDLLTVPVGATYVQFGYDYDFLTTISGTLIYDIYKAIPPATADIADDFAEISSSTFYPGKSLRASTMKQLAANIREAAATPEFFISNYAHGATVPLPTSPIDGYAYSRAELMYIWDYDTTSPDDDVTDRMNAINAHIDSSTGVVNIDVYRFGSGASGWDLQNHGTLRVITFAKRQASHTFADPSTVTAVAGSITDDGSNNDTVNGV
jgi:hypothetical protein